MKGQGGGVSERCRWSTFKNTSTSDERDTQYRTGHSTPVSFLGQMPNNKDIIILNNDMNLFSISLSLPRSSYPFQSGEQRAVAGISLWHQAKSLPRLHLSRSFSLSAVGV